MTRMRHFHSVLIINDFKKKSKCVQAVLWQSESFYRKSHFALKIDSPTRQDKKWLSSTESNSSSSNNFHIKQKTNDRFYLSELLIQLSKYWKQAVSVCLLIAEIFAQGKSKTFLRELPLKNF